MRNWTESAGLVHNFTIFKPSVHNKMMNISKSWWQKKQNPRSPLSIPTKKFHLLFLVSLLTSDLDMCSTSNNDVSNVPSLSWLIRLINHPNMRFYLKKYGCNLERERDSYHLIYPFMHNNFSDVEQLYLIYDFQHVQHTTCVIFCYKIPWCYFMVNYILITCIYFHKFTMQDFMSFKCFNN